MTFFPYTVDTDSDDGVRLISFNRAYIVSNKKPNLIKKNINVIWGIAIYQTC